MEAKFDEESIKKDMIKKCLLFKKKLKKLQIKLRAKKNVCLKNFIRELSLECVAINMKVADEKKSWNVIEMWECRVDVKLLSDSEKVYSNDNRFQTEYRCRHPGCKSVFKNKKSLTNHRNVPSDKYQCQVCQKCFPSPSHLQTHFRIHTGELPFVCDWVGCGKQFNNISNLKIHIKFKHSQTNDRPFACKWIGCGQRFKEKSVLKRHFITHTDKRPFKCGENGCDKSFKIKGSLQVHLQTYHSSLRTFQCQVQGCDLRFKVKESLRRHVKYVHSDVRKFRCDFENCQKLFKNLNHLKRHEKIHC